MPRVPKYTRYALWERVKLCKLCNERIAPEAIVADVLPLALLADLFDASVAYVKELI